MSEQSKILAELQTLIMSILASGSASPEQGARIDELEALMLQQKCYQKIDHDEYTYLGEEIAGLFAGDHYMEAIEKMCTSGITPEDFFGFIEYHDEEEEYIDLFTDTFIQEAIKVYQSKCQQSSNTDVMYQDILIMPSFDFILSLITIISNATQIVKNKYKVLKYGE